MIRIGSARHDEYGKYTGGTKGDQLQKANTNDLSGEVSIQEMYNHSKKWMVHRPKSRNLAEDISRAMYIACNNKCIGYSQSCQRKTPDNIATAVPINVDCSKLMRDIIFYVTGKDVGNFTTANEGTVLQNTGLFEKPFEYKNQKETPVCNGDILVTKTKGHTAIVIDGNERPITSIAYYPKYTGSSGSIITALSFVGEKDTSLAHRKVIAQKNGIANYSGTYAQNVKMLSLLKQGILRK